METSELPRLFDAMADPVRFAVIERLSHGPCRASELAALTNTSRSRMSQHLRVLLEAGITRDERGDDARVRIFTLRPESIGSIGDWLDGLKRHWDAQLESFKAHVEARDDE